MTIPSLSGRDNQGRFAAGNPGGPGNPYARWPPSPDGNNGHRTPSSNGDNRLALGELPEDLSAWLQSIPATPQTPEPPGFVSTMGR